MDDQSQDRQDDDARRGGERGRGAEHEVVCDMARALPVLRGEVALLRAYLGEEIGEILFGEH
jgi:hypothetical protein